MLRAIHRQAAVPFTGHVETVAMSQTCVQADAAAAPWQLQAASQPVSAPGSYHYQNQQQQPGLVTSHAPMPQQYHSAPSSLPYQVHHVHVYQLEVMVSMSILHSWCLPCRPSSAECDGSNPAGLALKCQPMACRRHRGPMHQRSHGSRAPQHRAPTASRPP